MFSASIIQSEHTKLKLSYEAKAKPATGAGGMHSECGSTQEFPKMPRDRVPSPRLILWAFVCDCETAKSELCRELRTHRSKCSYAINHRGKIVKKVRKTNNELKLGTQSFTVCSDCGLIHDCVVVPDAGTIWSHCNGGWTDQTAYR